MKYLNKKANNSLKLVGSKQVLKAIIFSEAKLKCVVLASDAKQDIIEPIIDLCKQKQIQVYYVENKKQLGRFAGIQVNAACIALMSL